MEDRNQESASQIIFLEDVLPKTGWGIYYRFMLGMACACRFAQALASVSISFAIPMWMCETYANKEKIIAIHTSFILGRAVGGYIFNSLCDIYGRKKCLNYSLVLLFLSTFSAAFGYNYYIITTAAFFLGSGAECNDTVVKVHFAEILPQNRRGMFLALIEVFWTFGYIFIYCFSAFMRNSTVVDYRAIDMKLTTWRMMFAISGGLNLILACASALLEESPRYFLNRRKSYLALLILKQFYAINNSSYAESFNVKESDLSNIILDYNLPFTLLATSRTNEFKRVMKINSQSIKLLFSEPFVKSCLVMLAIKTSLLILGTLDVNILLAKHLTSRTIADGMEIVYLDVSRNGTMCTDPNKALYHNFFILAVNIILGQVIAMLSIDRIGRKIILVSALVLTGGSFISIQFLKTDKSYAINLLSSSILMIAFSAAFTTASTVNIEIFPTAFRCTSIGLANFLGLFLQIFIVRFFSLFHKWYCVIAGSIYIGSAFAACFIQDLKRQPMSE